MTNDSEANDQLPNNLITKKMNLYLIIITSVISLLALLDGRIIDDNVFHPHSIKYEQQYYRFFSYVLVHNSWVHLLINMVLLYFFGKE